MVDSTFWQWLVSRKNRLNHSNYLLDTDKDKTMQKELTLDIVSKLLADKNSNISQQDLPAVICSLLQPFIRSKRISKSVELSLNKVILSYGICSRCHNEKIRKATDLYCKFCKSALKEQAKKVIL